MNPSTKMNTKVTFNCRSGMRINGSDEAVCLPSGNWSSETPNCLSMNCNSFKSTKHKL